MCMRGKASMYILLYSKIICTYLYISDLILTDIVQSFMYFKSMRNFQQTVSIKN